ncbi:hypothetical protein OG21DRAFT_1195821 [Imleria badia]|nr:hypothetical protein OG21DRAFT_1195821 [Imleria badia]
MEQRGQPWCPDVWHGATSFACTTWSLRLSLLKVTVIGARRSSPSRIASPQLKAHIGVGPWPGNRGTRATGQRVVSQEDRIAGPELSQRAEKDAYKRTIQELTTELDNMKVDDDKKKTRDDAFDSLCQSFKNLQ